jgi:hypothetical protein
MSVSNSRELNPMKNRLNVSDSAPQGAEFRIEDEFYEAASDLRAQFDEGVLNSPVNGGMTLLTYAFCKDVYQCLTASAQRVFRPDSIDGFLSRVRSWAVDTLQTTKTSTPQVRVYVGGCRRSLARDNVSHPWHYILWLSPNDGRKTGTVRILRDESAISSANGRRSLSVHLRFNQLLVHRTAFLYSVETPKLSMNPSEGIVFVDGYLW